MLFGIRFLIALLSSGIYYSAAERYETKIIPPTKSNLTAIQMTDDTALYMYIAAVIVSLGFFIVLILMYSHESKANRETPFLDVALILLIVATYFKWYETILLALQMMLVAQILVFLRRRILRI